MSASINVPEGIRIAINDGAAVALNLSGGKDSQAMASAVLRYLAENECPNPVYGIHADLGRAEWHQTPAVVQAQAEAFGIDLTVVMRDTKNYGRQDLLDRIILRAEQVGETTPFFPTGGVGRYCTSDMKRDPINKWLRSLPHEIVISVEGVRAEESANRAKQGCAERRTKIVTRNRDAWTWRPIHAWTEAEVWAEIGGRQGANVHPAYGFGNERLSCSLCVFASKGDLARGAFHNPGYANDIADLEEQYGWTFTQTTSITELCKSLGIRRRAAA